MVPNYVVPERPVIEIKTTSPSEMFDYYNIYLLSKEYHLTSNPLEDRALVIVDLAATLLHELAHVCGRAVRGAHGDTPNNPGGGACAESYRIENMFRWAMFTRYPDIQISQCRPRANGTFVNIDDFWGSSETNYPSNWCL